MISGYGTGSIWFWSDCVCRGPKLRNAVALFGPWTIEIVTGFERTFAWLGCS